MPELRIGSIALEPRLESVPSSWLLQLIERLHGPCPSCGAYCEPFAHSDHGAGCGLLEVRDRLIERLRA